MRARKNQTLVKGLTTKKDSSINKEATGLGVIVGISKLPVEDQWDDLKDGIHFNRNLKLRAITQEDEEKFENWGFEKKRELEYLVLELKNSTFQKIREDFNPIQNALLAFRLFKTGDIFLEDIYVIPHGIDRIKMRIYATPMPRIFASYKMGKDDIDGITNIFAQIQRVNFKQKSSFMIACDRFGRYYQNYRLEDKLIDLCIGFEALFLKGGHIRTGMGKGELIGLACSMLLGQNNRDRNKISKVLREAFDCRNKLVHGAKVDMLKKWKIFSDLEEYLRKSILRLIP